jgi:membrane-associated phospholipid phosphatase
MKPPSPQDPPGCSAASDPDPAFRRLLRQTLVGLFACASLVAFCYFFVDRPVARFVYDQGLSRYVILKWFTYPPPFLQTWGPLVLAGLMVRRAYGPFRRCELTLLAACVSLLVAVQFKDTLKYASGRYWPETWTHDNPSLIGTDAYGFHPFHGGPDYGSFPSGHMTRTLAIVAVVWIVCPRWRWACVLASMAVASGLIGMNYHFVGDVIAGGFTGAIIGVYTAHFCGPCRAHEGRATAPQ